MLGYPHIFLIDNLMLKYFVGIPNVVIVEIAVATIVRKKSESELILLLILRRSP